MDYSVEMKKLLKIGVLQFFSGVIEDAKWCIVANPDCSQDYTQKHCKNYCGISEGNYFRIYILILRPNNQRLQDLNQLKYTLI